MRALLVTSAAMLAVFAVACGDDDDDDDGADNTPSATRGAGGDNTPAATQEAGEDEQAIRDLIDEFLQAWNARDFDAVKALHTEQGLIAELDSEADLSTEEAQRAAFDQQTADFSIGISSVEEVSTNGDTGTATLLAYQVPRANTTPVNILATVELALVRESGEWLIDDLAFPPTAKPESGTEVAIDATEFAFALPEPPTTGDLYFALANKGAQPHHIVLMQVPDADFDVEAALQSDETQPGVVELGGTAPVEPGDTGYITFSGALPPGNYVMLCFIPDADDPEGTPHAAKGMWAKFAIE
jgi:uncharacterized protein (TIGR02246 family)